MPNPGRIGIGVVLVSPDGLHAEKSALTGHSGCNNEAELSALCMALDMAFEAGARRLQLRGDSDVAIRYATGPASTRIARLVALVGGARQRLARFDDVQLIWIPRHRNLEADRLSRRALGLPAADADAATGGRRAR